MRFIIRERQKGHKAKGISRKSKGISRKAANEGLKSNIYCSWMAGGLLPLLQVVLSQLNKIIRISEIPVFLKRGMCRLQTARIFAAFVGLKVKIEMSIEKFREELKSSFSFSVRHIIPGGPVYRKKPVSGVNVNIPLSTMAEFQEK